MTPGNQPLDIKLISLTHLARSKFGCVQPSTSGDSSPSDSIVSPPSLIHICPDTVPAERLISQPVNVPTNSWALTATQIRLKLVVVSARFTCTCSEIRPDVRCTEPVTWKQVLAVAALSRDQCSHLAVFAELAETAHCALQVTAPSCGKIHASREFRAWPHRVALQQGNSAAAPASAPATSCACARTERADLEAVCMSLNDLYAVKSYLPANQTLLRPSSQRQCLRARTKTRPARFPRS